MSETSGLHIFFVYFLSSLDFLGSYYVIAVSGCGR